MSRSYHIDVVEHAADAERRWVDNLLARFELPGVESVGQGATRQISNVGVYHVALVSRLVRAMGIALEPASSLAIRLLSAGPGEPIALLGELRLDFDRSSFIASVDARIAEAVETVVPRRRGRPRRVR